MTSGEPERPRIVFLHFTAPPVVGGVEAVIAEHIRLFSDAGFPTLVVAGRAAETEADGVGPVHIIPEMDSENPVYLSLQPEIDESRVPPQFRELQEKIEAGLRGILQPSDIVIAHNIMTTHFNLALTGAVHQLVEEGRLPQLIVWCHDISRHVNPERDAVQRFGQPWDLLRTRIDGATYVAVSSSRRGSLAKILHCAPELIRVISNGVDPVQLLGLSELGMELIREFDLMAADLILLMPVRITKVKNIEFALEVTEALKKAGMVVRLIVTGPPDPHVAEIPEYYQGLLDQRRRLGLTEEAIFVHEGMRKHPAPLILETDTVAELYRISDLILMPSIREGFGMPVLEAALVDRPVFATPIPVLEELPDFKHVIQFNESAESVATRIRQWTESDEAHRLRRHVRSNLTWSKIFARKILPLVEGVASSKNRPAA